MNAGASAMTEAWRRDLAAWLAADPALAALVNGVHEADPVIASEPYVVLGEGLALDWGVKDRTGREARIALHALDRGDRPDRIAGIVAAIDARLAAMPAAGDDYRLVSLVYLRGRTARDADRRWRHTLEYRARLLAADPS